MSLSPILETLHNLNVGIIGKGNWRHERPHKPCLVLAVLDLIERGEVMDGRVRWSSALRERWRKYFDSVRQADDQPTPENPFLYLRKDGFWEPMRIQPGGGERPLDGNPTVGDAQAGTVFAQLSEKFLAAAATPLGRQAIRDVLVSRFFPEKQSQVGAVVGQRSASQEEAATTTETFRSGAFRRLVVEAYDNQCCACGLRIKIPQYGASFVDAAHLIPFAESHNDHPTNGIALCKNHHWAMDRSLICPDLEGGWAVSKSLKPTRSSGEEELAMLREMTFLEPQEEAYFPSETGIRWRLERLA